MKKMTKSQTKVGKVMREFKKGELHSGKSGKIVKILNKQLQLHYLNQVNLENLWLKVVQ
jgi:hypothetical protein